MRRDVSYRLPILVSTAGLLGTLLFHMTVRGNSPPPTLWIYWATLVVTLMPGVLSGNKTALGFSVGSFVFLQSFAYLLTSSYGIVYSRDPIYNMQAAQSILDSHFWRLRVGSFIAQSYSYYPGSNLFHVGVAVSTGLSANDTYMFATGLVRFAVLPLALYRIFVRFLRETVSMVIVALYFASPSYLLNLPVQQEFALVFVALGMHAAFLAPRMTARPSLSTATLVAAIMFLTTVAMSHHFSSYVFIGVFLTLALAGLAQERKMRGSHRTATQEYVSQALRGFRYVAPAFTYVFFLWSIFVSSPLDIYWLEYADAAFQRAFGPGALERPAGVGSAGVRPGYTYSTLELGLIGAAFLIIFIAAMVGAFLLLTRRRRGDQAKRPSAKVLLVLVAIALFLVVAAVPLTFTRGFFVPLRVAEFAGFGLAPLAAMVLVYARGRRFPPLTFLVGILVATIVVGGSLVHIANPRFHYLAPEDQYCELPPHVTPDVLRAVAWAKEHIDPRARILGDELVLDSFGGHGGFYVAAGRLPAYALFNATQITANLSSFLGLRVGDIIIVHRYMYTSICFETLRSRPFEPEKIDKFATSVAVDRMFANQSVTIYRWVGFS